MNLLVPNSAINQIQVKRYDTYLRNEGRVTVWAYGILWQSFWTINKKCK